MPVSQHKTKKTTACDCSVGGPDDVFHVSWKCAHYASFRAPISHLSRRILRSKSCFRFATIACEDDADLATDVVLVPQTLVNIWQASIKNHLYGDLGPGARGPQRFLLNLLLSRRAKARFWKTAVISLPVAACGAVMRYVCTGAQASETQDILQSYKQCVQKDLDRCSGSIHLLFRTTLTGLWTCTRPL